LTITRHAQSREQTLKLELSDKLSTTSTVYLIWMRLRRTYIRRLLFL